MALTKVTGQGIDNVTVDSSGLNFGDNGKTIFGAGSDLQIFHDGSFSKIIDAGTGDLLIGADNNITFTNAAVSENKAIFTTNGAVTLYYDNAIKFATTATGVDVTGNIDFSGGILASNGSVQFVMDKDNNGSEVFVWGHNADNATTNELMRLDSSGTVTATAINASQSSQTAIGATCMGWLNNTTTNPGTAIAGTSISFSNTIGDYRPSTFGVGTWRCHGAVLSGSLNQEVSVWQRIS